MRELPYLIKDVRENTDNKDVNGVKDKEIIRYFQDCIRSIQAIVFKNNPLCSYFQQPLLCERPVAGKTFDLASDTYGDNAVSMVEVQSDASIADTWGTLDRCWAEEQNQFIGWFTRNKTIVFTGYLGSSIAYAARVWYFQRLPRWDKVWATVASVAGQVLTLTVEDADFFGVDNYITILKADNSLRVAGLKFSKTTDTTITVVGSLVGVIAGDKIVMGKNTTLEINLPEEVETYILDYVAKRVAARQNYTTDTAKIELFTAEAKENIISIFADVGQAQIRTPISDTGYLHI